MTHLRLLPSLLAAAGLVLSSLAAGAAEPETTSIKFSNPDQPGTLKLSIANGDIRIRGTDADEVTVRSSLKPEGRKPRKDGLRVLSGSSNYSLHEKDNVVTLSYGSWAGGAAGDFDVSVPRRTNIVVSTSFGGDVEVSDLDGDVEVKSLNGDIRLDGLAGGALVETTNGGIRVGMRALGESKPLSFSSMNGAVTLRLPVDARANFKLRSQNGSILTDFDEQQLVTTTSNLRKEELKYGRHPRNDAAEIGETVREAVEFGLEAAREATRAAREAIREARNSEREMGISIPIPPVPPLPPMTGGKIVTGTLNGGGPEIRISTMNGDVTLRKAE